MCVPEIAAVFLDDASDDWPTARHRLELGGVTDGPR